MTRKHLQEAWNVIQKVYNHGIENYYKDQQEEEKEKEKEKDKKSSMNGRKEIFQRQRNLVQGYREIKEEIDEIEEKKKELSQQYESFRKEIESKYKDEKTGKIAPAVQQIVNDELSRKNQDLMNELSDFLAVDLGKFDKLKFTENEVMYAELTGTELATIDPEFIKK